MSQVDQLPVPDGPPVFQPDMAIEDKAATSATHPRYGQFYGRWFRRPRWIRK